MSNTAIKQPKLNQTDKKVLNLMNQDVSTTDISKVVGIHPNSVSRIKANLSKYAISYDKKLAKKSKKVQHKILDDFMLGKPNVKASDALTLVKMQQDRIDPAVQQIEARSEVLVAVLDLTSVG